MEITGLSKSGENSKLWFSFSGTAKEYFGIWIVNLLLSIVTIGIYTAWAKVRRLRYFYGNTWLDGHNFEYHAKPMQILIGRIIVVVVLVVFNVLAEVNPVISLFLLIPYFIILPWLINKALSFNARMTSYRNVHFSFDGSYGSAFWVFVVLPLIVPVVFGALIFGYIYSSGSTPLANPNFLFIIVGLSILGLIAYLAIIPYISKQVNMYIANRTRFGTAKFEADISLSLLGRNLIVPAIVGLGPILLLSIIGYSALQGSGGGILFLAGSAGQVLIAVTYIAIIVGFLMYSAGVRNIAFDASILEGGHRLRSSVSRGAYAGIMVSNLIVSVLTIALMVPWAAVRTWRYLADNTAIQSPGLDQFVADQEAQGSVVAAEYLDIDGIDFGL